GRHVAGVARLPRVDEAQRCKAWRVGQAWRAWQQLRALARPTCLARLTRPAGSAEIRGGQRFELHRRVAAAPRVAVPRKVHQIERRTCATDDAIDVGEPRL